jgi:hypothetical protein
MCGYAFLSEPAPPRTIFRARAEAAPTPEDPMTLTEEAAVNTLPDYPDAYRAFMKELERLRGLRERAP